MLVAPVIAGAMIFGLLVSWDAIFYGGGPTAGNRTNASQTYNNPAPDGSNGTTLFYGSDTPIYLEERVSGSEYTQREDNRTFVSD